MDAANALLSGSPRNVNANAGMIYHRVTPVHNLSVTQCNELQYAIGLHLLPQVVGVVNGSMCGN